MSANFPVPANDRYFEDYEPGRVYEFGGIVVTETEIVSFAERYDPQPMHVDPEAAKESRFGGLIACGWHTASVAMRLYVDHYLSHVASLASPGVDDLRWPNPVRPGDTLRIRVSLVEARPSRSKPDRGIVRCHVEGINQNDEVVLSMYPVSIIGRRPPA